MKNDENFREKVEKRLKDLEVLLEYHEKGICNLTRTQQHKILVEIDILKNLLK